MGGQTEADEISEGEYSRLLHALTAVPKGRSFLAEHLRRARPQETLALIASLQRIEATIQAACDQLRPGALADELSRIGMALDIAMDGIFADPEGDESARRAALILEVRDELGLLAGALGDQEPR